MVFYAKKGEKELEIEHVALDSSLLGTHQFYPTLNKMNTGLIQFVNVMTRDLLRKLYQSVL